MLLDAGQPEMVQVWEDQTSNTATHLGQICKSTEISDTVLSITNETFQQEILESEQPVILLVYATWCGPCQKSAPVFANLSREYIGKVKFARLNISSEEKLANQLGVNMVPTCLFYMGGKIVDRSVGVINREDFIVKIANSFR